DVEGFLGVFFPRKSVISAAELQHDVVARDARPGAERIGRILRQLFRAGWVRRAAANLKRVVEIPPLRTRGESVACRDLGVDADKEVLVRRLALEGEFLAGEPRRLQVGRGRLALVFVGAEEVGAIHDDRNAPPGTGLLIWERE